MPPKKFYRTHKDYEVLLLQCPKTVDQQFLKMLALDLRVGYAGEGVSQSHIKN